jgi:hypothetical protein
MTKSPLPLRSLVKAEYPPLEDPALEPVNSRDGTSLLPKQSKTNAE